MSDENNHRNQLLNMLGKLRDLSVQQKMFGKVQEMLGDLEVTGEAGAGLVKVTLTGTYEAIKVEIAEIVMEDPRKEFIEQLVAAAVTDATRKVGSAVSSKTAEALKSLGDLVTPGANVS